MKPYPSYKPSGVESLGEVPEHWELEPLGRLGRLFKGNGASKEDEVDEGIPCVRYGDLYTRHEYVINGTKACISPDRADAYTRIQFGDVLFAASGETYEDIGRSAVNLLTSDARCGGDVLVLRPSREVVPRFLGYASDSAGSRAQKATMGRGFTVVHIYAGQLKQLALPLPPLDEQQSIADYLDRATAKIDTLVAKKRELIERLREQRSAIISRTVTRGLDPNVPLKPSGVDWLGDVPVHWEVTPLEYLVRFNGGATPDKSKPEFWDGEIPWVSPKDMKRSEISDSEDHITEEALGGSSLRLLPPGRLLVVVRGMILAHSFPVAVNSKPVTINQDMKALSCGRRLEHHYLFWALTGFAGAFVTFADESAHGTRKLETEVLSRFPFPLPPVEEQRIIVDYLDRETGEIDAMVAKVGEAVERLQEYRSALITAAATGKIDVRGATC